MIAGFVLKKNIMMNQLIVEALQDKQHGDINNYIDILKYHKPNELLQLYKN